MIVVCVEDGSYPLTEGKAYKVLRDIGGFYEICNDEGNNARFFKFRFKVAETASAEELM